MDDFKFNVGDTVKVINCGNAYTTYENWFKEQELGSYYTTRYAYGINPKVINNSNTVYKVVKRGIHHCGYDNLYLIQRDCYEQSMFLIGEEGLKAVKDKVLVKIVFVIKILRIGIEFLFSFLFVRYLNTIDIKYI